MDDRIIRGFNNLAPVYDLLVKIFSGFLILKSQNYFLPGFKNSKSVLIFGGGTGRILIEILKQNHSADFTYVDFSEKMIERAKHRLSEFYNIKSSNHSLLETRNVDFINGSYNSIDPAKTFDLIITPYVLDCIRPLELKIAIDTLNNFLLPEGNWLFVDFHIPDKQPARFFARFIIRLLYIFFNIACGLGMKKLPEFQKYFDGVNYKTKNEKLFLSGLLIAKIFSKPAE